MVDTKGKKIKRGFTLIETMVAVSVLVIALTAPLTLASQSLFAAVYAKDQMIASYLAQEGVEVVREKRDGNLLKRINGVTVNWLSGIPQNTPFFIDVPNNTITNCNTTCYTTPLRYDGTFYNYKTGTATRFFRNITVVPSVDEATITSTVRWKTGSLKERSITIKENIYNWVPPVN